MPLIAHRLAKCLSRPASWSMRSSCNRSLWQALWRSLSLTYMSAFSLLAKPLSKLSIWGSRAIAPRERRREREGLPRSLPRSPAARFARHKRKFKQRRFWATYVNLNWAFFSLKIPWRYQIFFAFIETICSEVCSKSRLMRRSKTSLLKLPIKKLEHLLRDYCMPDNCDLSLTLTILTQCHCNFLIAPLVVIISDFVAEWILKEI